MQAKKLFDFNERRNAAEEARKAAAEKFQAMQARLDDPEVQKRLAEQKALGEARAAREAEKRAARQAVRAAEEAAKLAAKREAERKAQEELARRRAAEIEAANAAARRAADQRNRAVTLAAAHKTMQDARKARQR